MFAKRYANYYDMFNEDKPYKKEIEFVYKWAWCPEKIFDIGCGTANYWKYYPKGTYLKGVDQSNDMAQKNKNISCADITRFKTKEKFNCATALFDVINYIPEHKWWKHIPISKGDFFIFDIWDTRKIKIEGFKQTHKTVNGFTRRITPVSWDSRSVDLRIEVFDVEGLLIDPFKEHHRLYLHTPTDIKIFCGTEFDIADVKATGKWQTWYKLKRK
jgi:SAM-dependent methyltransferase